MRIAYIDHYDSFTANLIDWLTASSLPVEVIFAPYDDIRGMAKIAHERLPLVISPGPKSPAEAESTVHLLRDTLGKVPILGVCLGQQILAVAMGGKISGAGTPIHGIAKDVFFDPHSRFFENAPPVLKVGVYNSLIVSKDSIPADLKISATCQQGEPQAVEYWPENGYPAVGVQFHPESFLSEECGWIRDRWLTEVLRYAAARETI